MAKSLIRQLVEGGGYNLPYLLQIYNDDKSIVLHLVNDNQAVHYAGVEYAPSTFTYNPADDGSANLEIELIFNSILLRADNPECVSQWRKPFENRTDEKKRGGQFYECGKRYALEWISRYGARF